MGSEFAGRKLLSPEREKLIVDSLAGGVRTIAELSSRLGVSEATVRRDLQSLEERRLVRRVHGGAEPVRRSGAGELLFNEKTSLHAAEKELIAERALDYIQDNDAIFLDGSCNLQVNRKDFLWQSLKILWNWGIFSLNSKANIWAMASVRGA